jgi:hypothetical protein
MNKDITKKPGLIAYCGLYCGSCPAYTQSIANLARGLHKELSRSKCDKAAPALARIPAFSAFKHYQKCRELLDTMAKMRCKKSCRSGGGSARCQIRKCVKEKGYDGCWQCDDFAACRTLKILEEFGDVDKTYLKNLRGIRKKGLAAFLKAKTR